MPVARLGRPAAAEPRPLPPPLDAFLDVLNRDQRTALTIDRAPRAAPSRRRPPQPHRLAARPPAVASAFASTTASATASTASTASTTASTASAEGRPPTPAARGPGPRRRLARLVARLGEVFVVGVCLLTVVRVPAVMSAPSTRHAKATDQLHPHKPTENTLSYLHPCGKTHEEDMNKTYYKMAAAESDPDILKHIIIRTKNALAYAESFRERYVESTFHIRFEKHHAQWASQGYDWLPGEANGVPKRLGKAVAAVHLSSKTLDEFLISIYEYLQKYAVGLEQIVADQKRTQGEFRENFRLMEVHLRSVLCEIREAMMERNIAPREQVPRSIMSEDIRHLEQASFRNVRDWFIFRDLMNGLEYTIQVLSFFEEELGASS